MPVELSAIASALSSLKAAKDIAEAMIGLRDGAAFQGKLMEFQSKIIDANNAAFAAQDERSTLLERVNVLEKKISEFEAWEAERKRYQLEQFEPGVSVYVLKEEMAAGDPIHHACPNCFANRKPRILQATDRVVYRRRIRVCNDCKSEFAYGEQSPLSPRPRVVLSRGHTSNEW